MLGDLDGAVVHREWNNIDLLIEIKQVGLVVLIENKIGAKAGEDQLARYKSVVESRFPREKLLFVFLTPEGDEPNEPGYISFSYSELAKVIETLWRGPDSDLSADAATIIRHYVEMLRRHIVPDEKLQDLARQLYERHKEAFDFVFECRPEPESLLEGTRALLEAQPGLVQDRHGANILRFVPEDWIKIAELNSCESSAWTKTGRNLLFEIKRTEDRLIVALIIGPAAPELRHKLYDGAAARPDLFRGLIKPMGRFYAMIYKRELLTPAAAKDLETSEKAAVIESAWQTFLRDDLPLLQSAVLDIIRAPKLALNNSTSAVLLSSILTWYRCRDLVRHVTDCEARGFGSWRELLEVF